LDKKYKNGKPVPEERIKHVIEHIMSKGIQWKKDSTMDKKLIIEASTPGHFYRDLWRPFGIKDIPSCTIEEQAQMLIDCVKAGAAAVHTHVNDPSRESCEKGPYHVLDANVEGDIFDRVFDEVDCVTLNHGWEVKPMTTKAYPHGEPKADYVTYHKELWERGKGNKYIQGSVIMTWSRTGGPHSADVITEGIKYMNAHDIKPMWNCHIDHLTWVLENFLETGLCKEPIGYNLQIGKHEDERYFSNPWNYIGVIYEMSLVKEALKDYKYTLGMHMEGRHWLPLTTLAIMLGFDNVRVGIEDMFWMYPHREDIIKTPVDSVKKVVAIAEELGREVATPKEAREILGVKRT
jgi:uncharacterized protein (DUF849 family)